MSSSDAVSEWLAQLKQGDPAAAQKVWQRYVEQLVQLASHRLGAAPRRVADEEDVAIVAFASFCRGVEDGRFSRLDDRDDLWQVLIMLTGRKAVDLIRREHADKRGAGQVRGESALKADGSSAVAGPAQVIDDAPTPQFVAIAADELQRLLGTLTSDLMRQIAHDKMKCFTNKEIAQRQGTSLRNIERQLKLIREIWEQDEIS